MKLSNKTYDVLKIITQYVLPAMSVLVFALANVWGFPAEKIIGTFLAIETALGIMLGISSANYKLTAQKMPGGEIPETSSIVLNPDVYDALKWVVRYFLPGLGAFYFAIATIWGLPYGEQIMGTIAAIDVFLGVLLGLSTPEALPLA